MPTPTRPSGGSRQRVPSSLSKVSTPPVTSSPKQTKSSKPSLIVQLKLQPKLLRHFTRSSPSTEPEVPKVQKLTISKNQPVEKLKIEKPDDDLLSAGTSGRRDSSDDRSKGDEGIKVGQKRELGAGVTNDETTKPKAAQRKRPKVYVDHDSRPCGRSLTSIPEERTVGLMAVRPPPKPWDTTLLPTSWARKPIKVSSTRNYVPLIEPRSRAGGGRRPGSISNPSPAEDGKHLAGVHHKAGPSARLQNLERALRTISARKTAAATWAANKVPLMRMRTWLVLPSQSLRHRPECVWALWGDHAGDSFGTMVWYTMITTWAVTLLANYSVVVRRMNLGHIDNPAVVGEDAFFLDYFYIHAARGLDAE